jgi:hypothetical protein
MVRVVAAAVAVAVATVTAVPVRMGRGQPDQSLSKNGRGASVPAMIRGIPCCGMGISLLFLNC